MSHQLLVKMVLDAWHQYIKRTDDLFNQLTDNQLTLSVAPGKNTGKYLLGHLTAVHDRMVPLLGFGDSLYPELFDAFEVKPDGPHTEAYTPDDLRRRWTEVNTTLARHFLKLTPSQWFERHNAISEEDFTREPHRNKLNVIINRTNHIAWHYGQLLLLKQKA